MAESATATRESDAAVESAVEARDRALGWLAEEFPAWEIDVDVTAGWNGIEKDLWVAERPGHHPQRALSAAKLHTRLDEYEERERQRNSFASA